MSIKEDNLSIDTINTINDLSNMNVVGESPVSKGDLLLTSTPFAFVLKSTLRGLHCDTCLRKKRGAQRCSSCASAYYCNRECQKNSWETHKKECPRLKKLKPKSPSDTARLMARIIFKLNDGGDDFEERIGDKKCRKFKDLMNHYNDVKEDSLRQDHFTSLLVVLKKYIGEENLPTSSELLAIYGRVLVNSYTITDKDMNPVGLGLYLAASVLDHSCQPNAYASFVGTQLAVRSLQDVQDLDWSEVRISYIDVLNTTKERNAELQKGYFFTCHCKRCSDEEREKVASSIACGNIECSAPLYVDPEEDPNVAIEPCSRCGFEDFAPGTRERYREVLQLTQEKLSEIKDKNSLDTCKMLQEEQGSLFHPLNLWRVRVRDRAFEAAIDSRMLDASVAYGSENVEGIRFYYGSNHPMYALLLLKLGKLELYMFRLQEALQHLEEAEGILKVSHGEEHPLYANDLIVLLEQAKQEIKMMQCNGFQVMKKSPGNQKTILP